MSKRRHPGWTRLAKVILAEHLRNHGAICQRCKRIRQNLQCHHVKPIADFPALEMTRKNIEVICVDCHREIHYIPPPPDRAAWDAFLKTQLQEVSA